ATPTVYITSRRFTTRFSTPTTVKVYSNMDSVELFVNGVSLGSKTSTDHRFIWPGVALNVGSNDVSAAGTTGGTTLTDNVTWTLVGPGPYGGSAAPVPGTIQAENFDYGGEGVAYHDFDASNNGGAYRAEGVDIQATGAAGSDPGGYDIGWVH